MAPDDDGLRPLAMGDLESSDTGRLRMLAMLYWAAASGHMVSVREIRAVPGPTGAPLDDHGLCLCEELQDEGLVELRGWDNPGIMRMRAVVAPRGRARSAA